jgi:dihydrodipicolinate synthase/N-acetylneuraminate lyase
VVGFSYLHATNLLATSAELGSDGLVGGMTGVVPEIGIRIWQAVQRGELDTARRLQDLILRVSRAVDLGPDLACLEVLYRARGLCDRISGSPQRGLDAATHEAIERILRECLASWEEETATAEAVS